jgi:hypothetical protein
MIIVVSAAPITVPATPKREVNKAATEVNKAATVLASPAPTTAEGLTNGCLPARWSTD